MTDITVILDTTPTVDIGALTPDERNLIFEQLGADNKDLSKPILDAFEEMQVEMSQQNVRWSKPTIKELLLRKIISLSNGYGNEVNTLVIPILFNDKLGGDFQNKSADKSATKKQSIMVKTSQNAIRVRFDSRILTANDYISPAGEELAVTGLVVNIFCKQQKNRFRGKLADINNMVISKTDMREVLQKGTYNHNVDSCELFIQPEYSITIGGISHNDSFEIELVDMDDDKIMYVLGTIYEYIIDHEKDINSPERIYLLYSQIREAIKGVGSNQLINVLHFKNYQIPPVYTPEDDKSPLLLMFESIINGKFSTKYDLSVLADIDLRGLTKIYHRALLKGKDDKSVLSSIAMHKDRKKHLEFQRAAQQKAIDESTKLGTYKMLIGKKLGVKRLGEIEHQLKINRHLTVEAKNILSLLTPSERKPVELEYERREKYLNEVLNNKCPHVKIYRDFRRARDDDRIKKMFDSLKKFFKNGNQSEHMISCNNCGFDIICPHIRDYTELDLKGTIQPEIKSKLTKYIDSAAAKDQFYCKICGEMISSLEAFGDTSFVRDPSSTMNEELKTFIWSEIAVLTRYLKFTNIVNTSQLITVARDVCYPFIFDIEKQILKSKTNSADEIKAKKRLYVTIYAFAYFVHLILSNTDRNNEISFKNFTPKNNKNPAVDLIRHSLELIVTSRNITIREIPGMSTDVIKNVLIEAYKSLQTSGLQVITYSGEAENMLTTLLLDPVYKYYYNMYIIDEALRGKRVPGPTKQMDIVDKIENVLGNPISKLEKSKDIFAAAHIPKFDSWGTKEFDNIKKLHKGFNTNTFHNAFSGYVARSFEHFLMKQTSRTYTQSMYIDVSASGKNDPNAPIGVELRPAHELIAKSFIDLVEKESYLMQYRSFNALQNFSMPVAKKTRRWRNPGVPLSRLYDEDGNPHVWSIFITEKQEEGKSQISQFKISDITSLLNSGKKFDEKITDKKCAICGILRSTISTLSDDKIRESLHSRHMINNFFRFYENRCPKSGLHDFNDNGICRKCAIVNSYFTSITNDAVAFYRKYKNIYLKERDEFKAHVETDSYVPHVEKSHLKYENEYEKWTFNFNVVLDLANKLKINHRLLSALGAVEKQEYSDVQSGTFLPSEPEERNSTWIFVVNSYIKNLITEYNQLRFFHRLTKPPHDISQLIDSSGINKHKIAELGEKLPDVLNDYNARFMLMQRTKKPKDIINFCVQSFCEFCLVIWNDNNKETEKLRHDFVTYIVKKILRGDELLSKPGYFNWSLLYGDADKEKSSYDMNTNRDIDTETDREFDDTEKEDDFGDTGSPMKAADFDVEEDPDAEDDDQQEWRVGEDLGLT